jgi:hypothetical protein
MLICKSTYYDPHVSLISGLGKIPFAAQVTLTWWPVGNLSCWKLTDVAGAEIQKYERVS